MTNCIERAAIAERLWEDSDDVLHGKRTWKSVCDLFSCLKRLVDRRTGIVVSSVEDIHEETRSLSIDGLDVDFRNVYDSEMYDYSAKGERILSDVRYWCFDFGSPMCEATGGFFFDKIESRVKLSMHSDGGNACCASQGTLFGQLHFFKGCDVYGFLSAFGVTPGGKRCLR